LQDAPLFVDSCIELQLSQVPDCANIFFLPRRSNRSFFPRTHIISTSFGIRTIFDFSQHGASIMSKSQDAKKATKKEPAKTPKEKKEAKKIKKEANKRQ
jgi:hypothetical protein